MYFDFSNIIGFEWDKGNLEHISKHNVTKEECEEAFLNGEPYVTDDDTHSQVEERYRLYGVTNNGRQVFIIFTVRSNKIRVISSRDQDKKERQEYQQRGGENI